MSEELYSMYVSREESSYVAVMREYWLVLVATYLKLHIVE